jgi:protein SCO1/2
MSEDATTPTPQPAESPQPGGRLPLWAVGLALVVLAVVGITVARSLMASPSAEAPPGDAGVALRGFTLRPASAAPAFQMTDTAGQPWRMADQQGKVVALFFGYTNCPDVCPQTLALLSQTKAALGTEAGDLHVAMVTVDPARDTPATLQKYLTGFDPSFVGLTASDTAQLHDVAGRFGVEFAREVPPAEATRAAQSANMMTGMGATSGTAAAGMSGMATPTMAMGAAQPMTTTGHSANLPGNFQAGTPAYTVAHSGVVFLIDPHGRLRSSFIAPFDPADAAHDVRALRDEPAPAGGG